MSFGGKGQIFFLVINAVPDERIRPPQEAPGVITITKAVCTAVAARIEQALKENRISIAVRTVEGDGAMAGTPEVAIKLQQMYSRASSCQSPGWQWLSVQFLEGTR
jgi:hypothetical protein